MNLFFSYQPNALYPGGYQQEWQGGPQFEYGYDAAYYSDFRGRGHLVLAYIQFPRVNIGMDVILSGGRSPGAPGGRGPVSSRGAANNKPQPKKRRAMSTSQPLQLGPNHFPPLPTQKDLQDEGISRMGYGNGRSIVFIPLANIDFRNQIHSLSTAALIYLSILRRWLHSPSQSSTRPPKLLCWTSKNCTQFPRPT